MLVPHGLCHYRSNDEMTQAEMDNIRLYTCMVGKKPTHANFYVNDPSEVAQTLSRMAGTDKKNPAAAAAAAAERQQGRGGVDGVGSSSKGSARLESFLARSLM